MARLNLNQPDIHEIVSSELNRFWGTNGKAEVIAIKNIVYGNICILGLSGCATFKSLNTDIPLYQRIFIYSGTRLDWAALEHNDVAIRKINTTPPSYPFLDLPLSFALDSLLLPLAVSAEIFH